MNPRNLLTLVALLAGPALSGCVERTMTITSEPPGALVMVSDQEIGRTPVTVPFVWYGDHEFILRADGYETLKTHSQISPPLYDVPPWDLISQALVPWTYRYHVDRNFVLQPASQPSDAQLIENARALEQKNLEPVKRD